MRFIHDNPISSSYVISHIRKATRGPVATRNRQPFVREPGGAWHCFAHNGDLPGSEGDPRFRPQRFQDVVLVASVPLTAEGWQPLAEGEMVVARGGRECGSARSALV